MRERAAPFMMFVFALLGLNPSSFAQEAFLEERLDALQSRLARLERGRAIVELQASLPEERLEVVWTNRLEAQGTGGFKLRFGGRIHFDSIASLASDRIADGDGFDLRRTRLALELRLSRRLRLRLGLEFAGGEAELKLAFFELRELGPFKTLRIGKFTEPSGLERQVSTNDLFFLERSVATELLPGRQSGLMLRGEAIEGRLSYFAGLFRQSNDQGLSEPLVDGRYALSSRVVWRPLGHEGKEVLHLGASASWRRPGSGGIRLRARPEMRLAPRLLDTGPLEADGLTTLGFEVAWGGPGFDLQGEWIAMLRDAPGEDTFFHGARLSLAWRPDGSRRPYSRAKASFARPLIEDFALWEFALQVAYLDLDDADVRAGRLTNVSAGANLYLSPALRVSLAYVYSDRVGGQGQASAHLLGLRIQLVF